MWLQQWKTNILSVLSMSGWSTLFQRKNKADPSGKLRWRQWIGVSQLNSGYTLCASISICPYPMNHWLGTLLVSSPFKLKCIYVKYAPMAAEHRLFEQYPRQTKLLYIDHIWHHDCLFNFVLQICRFISYFIWLPWQQQTLNPFSFVTTLIVVNCIHLRNTKTCLFIITLDVIAVLVKLPHFNG